MPDIDRMDSELLLSRSRQFADESASRAVERNCEIMYTTPLVAAGVLRSQKGISGASKRFRIRLHGSFRLQAPDGSRIDIPSKKGIAIIGVLCKSPGYERRRAWLQSMFWGSRETDQAQASVRQEIYKLKSLLSAYGPLLRAESGRVWLDTDLVDIEAADGSGVFLEGIDIPGEEQFEDWLRCERADGDQLAPAVPSAVVPDPPPASASALSIEILEDQFSDSETSLLSVDSAGSILRDRVVYNLREFGGLQIHRASEGARGVGIVTGADLALRITHRRLAHLIHMSCTVVWTKDGKVLFSTTRRLSAEASRLDELFDSIETFANELAERILAVLAGLDDRHINERTLAARDALNGVYSLFSRDPLAAQRSAQHFDAAISTEESSAFYAWRAYLAALFLEEAPPEQHPAIREQAKDHCRKALELDSYNGLTLALLTHVHAFVLRDFEVAGDFLQGAMTIRPDHVMTQDAAALLNFYKGNLEAARTAALRSERLGQFLPYRYCFATTQSMIETMSGKFMLGIRHAERASALLPANNHRPYPPVLRYLGICYAQSGQLTKAAQAFSRLEALEGPVSSTDVESNAYPVPSSDAATLLSKSLRLIGR